MPRPRRNDRPAERTVAYIDPVVLDEINRWSGGLSIGEAVEKLWRDRKPAQVVVNGAAPPPQRAATAIPKVLDGAKPAPHSPENKGWGILCVNCGAVKGPSRKWVDGCPGKVL